MARLLELEPDLWLSQSWTTRARRPGEAEDAYVFVDRATFRDRLARHGFIEWVEFSGTGELYGTPTLEAPDRRDIVLEIELEGAQEIKRRYPEAVLIFIVAPSRAAQEQRLRARGDGEADVQRRLPWAARRSSWAGRSRIMWSSTTMLTGPRPRWRVYFGGNVPVVDACPGTAYVGPAPDPPIDLIPRRSCPYA